MKYAIVGGDSRSRHLTQELADDGNHVCTYALEKAELDDSFKSTSLLSCLDRADCVILPIPAEKNGQLNSPMSVEKLSVKDVLIRCTSQPVIGGSFGETHRLAAEEYGISLLDILEDEKFVSKNAAATAEGALGLIITESDRVLSDSRVLVCGYGRIGRALSETLRYMGADVTVAARNEQVRSTAASCGLEVTDISDLMRYAGGFDLIVNTVPAPILSDSALCTVDDGALLMELASPPGGFDRSFASNMGIKVLHAPGLPGRFSPVSAARRIKEYVYSTMEVRNGQ